MVGLGEKEELFLTLTEGVTSPKRVVDFSSPLPYEDIRKTIECEDVVGLKKALDSVSRSDLSGLAEIFEGLALPFRKGMNANICDTILNSLGQDKSVLANFGSFVYKKSICTRWGDEAKTFAFERLVGTQNKNILTMLAGLGIQMQDAAGLVRLIEENDAPFIFKDKLPYLLNLGISSMQEPIVDFVAQSDQASVGIFSIAHAKNSCQNVEQTHFFLRMIKKHKVFRDQWEKENINFFDAGRNNSFLFTELLADKNTRDFALSCFTPKNIFSFLPYLSHATQLTVVRGRKDLWRDIRDPGSLFILLNLVKANKISFVKIIAKDDADLLLQKIPDGAHKGKTFFSLLSPSNQAVLSKDLLARAVAKTLSQKKSLSGPRKL